SSGVLAFLEHELFLQLFEGGTPLFSSPQNLRTISDNKSSKSSCFRRTSEIAPCRFGLSNARAGTSALPFDNAFLPGAPSSHAFTLGFVLGASSRQMSPLFGSPSRKPRRRLAPVVWVALLC